MSLRLEAVTVCVGYSDFLDVVAKHNRGIFDRWVIVTSPTDTDTHQVCHKYSLQVLHSDEHTRDGGPFGKGRLVEMGLRQLSKGAWHLQIDADIVLPRNARTLLEMAWLQTDKVYGCDRIMVQSYEDWIKFEASGWLDKQYLWGNCITPPEGYKLGTRWCSELTGYVPIGFFQLAHQSETEKRGVRFHPYPNLHGDACRTDVQYALQWDRHRRELLPELFAVHLESGKAPNGANWNGRTTPRFGPPRPVASQPPPTLS